MIIILHYEALAIDAYGNMLASIKLSSGEQHSARRKLLNALTHDTDCFRKIAIWAEGGFRVETSIIFVEKDNK